MGKYKIALVEASSGSTNIFSRAFLPRVGLPTIGAVMKGLGYKCDLWFQAMPGFSADRLLDYDIVGIGSITSTIESAYDLADFLKGSGATVVMGGPHVTFMREEALGHCDYVVAEEGDNTFPALVKALEDGAPLENIPGIAFADTDGKPCYTGPIDPVDYAALPSPDFTLSPQIRTGKTPPIISTSRGCPHNCSFCSVTAMFKRAYRFKSDEQIMSELGPIRHRSVCFGDDNFFARPERTKTLLRGMIEQDSVPLRWSGEMPVRAASDKELLGLMQKTGCRIVYVGVESVDPDTLKRYGKAHKTEATDICIKNLHLYDIGIHGMFVVDPLDTPDTVKKIVDYSIEKDIDTIQICSLTPFPGTRAFETYKDRLLHRNWRYFDGMHVVAEPMTCSAYEMQMAIVNQMQRFYSFKRVLNSYRSGRAWRVKYRLGGFVLMKRWVAENTAYIYRLKERLYAPGLLEPREA